MEPITAAIINLGATGVLSAVLFYLHTTSTKASREDRERDVKAFKEEIKAERELCREDHEKIMAGITVIGENVNRARSKLEVIRSEMTGRRMKDSQDDSE